MSQTLKKVLIWAKDIGVLLTAVTVIFVTGRTYQTVQDMKIKIDKAVPQTQYQEDKKQEEKAADELKQGISNLDKKLDSRFDCITVRLDSLYQLILGTGEKLAGGE
jgi:signal transduction histidine kinase